MPKQTINDIPGAIPQLPVFSQAVVSNGTVYVSGSIGSDDEYRIVGGIEQQTDTALENMKKLLEGAGSGLDHVVKVTIYLSNLNRDYLVVNNLYAQFFERYGVEVMPARSCIGVDTLAMGAFIEVECIGELAPRVVDDTAA